MVFKAATAPAQSKLSLPSISLLLDAVRGHERVAAFSPADWDLVIRQARRADLLARMGSNLSNSPFWMSIAPEIRRHIESEMQVCARQQRELTWEVSQILSALANTGVPVVLLKGAAYVMARLDAARGRMVSDIDILVPRQKIGEIETALMLGGWISTTKSAYDQRYYRTWMHELPPMQHFKRGTVIDVHHAILPLTARYYPSSEKLLSDAQFLPGSALLKVLAPTDMMLHSAAHLFHEGELEKGLKGLLDIENLLNDFRDLPDFWERLLYRAKELDLARPLFYAVRYAKRLTATPFPDEFIKKLGEIPAASPGPVQLHLMDALFIRGLRPDHASTSDRFTPLARALLYLRGHWLRMPPILLVRHLVTKLVSS